ncbi:hypothetical protein G3I70_27605 [Actinomadura bangladeshensis]|uniref:Uncharacterized protein n=1 Tax=Actinomadura bangladeshensis TaxID=453573 RepID=A0A6L9QM69_9ACTN|nr:hypothetical protein [Actinomadura bangladeshensis]
MTFDSNEAERLLQRHLLGVPLFEVGRLGFTVILGFGCSVSWRLTSSGTELTGGEFALHIQCPMRIRQADRIVLGTGDMDGQCEVMPYDKGAESLQGYLSKVRPIVKFVDVRDCGELRLGLDHSISIDILPVSSLKVEEWRFLHRHHEHYSFPDGPS